MLPSYLRILILLLTFGSSLAAPAAPASFGFVRLYIHGINSNASTWNDLLPGNGCPIVRSGVPLTAASRCYRLQFSDRIINGITWPAGDGATLNQLRVEIQRAVRQIRTVVEPRHMILIAHSRGGLAARAYIQDLPRPLPFPVGLVLIGTPNQGTPLGRISVWAQDRNVDPGDITKELRFAFSPGAAELATDPDSNGQLVRTPISERTFLLNQGITTLTARTGSIGQLNSAGLRLGESISGDLDALSGVGAQLLAFITPGSFDSLLHYVLQNIALIRTRPILIDTFSCANERKQQYPYACDGDGVVPAISQRVELVPGYLPGGTPLHTIEVANVPHDRETRQISQIQTLIRQVRQDISTQ